MIRLGFSLGWPFNEIKQKDYIEKTWKLSKNKNLEVQMSQGGNSLIGLSLNFSLYGRDHAGLMFEIELFRHFFIINFYDKRHWDYENNCWEEH